MRRPTPDPPRRPGRPPSSHRPPGARAERGIDDYRRFRALSIDLAGRAPTRAEIAELEAPGFDLDRWIDAHLEGSAYVERLERVYMDLLRLEVGPAFQFIPPATTLHRQTLVGPDKKPVHVYYRHNQRRHARRDRRRVLPDPGRVQPALPPTASRRAAGHAP